MQEIQIFNELKQGSDEWHNLRLGKITGSCFYKLLGTPAASKKYLYQKASEIITNAKSDSESFNNVHIQRGLDYECVAKAEYIKSNWTIIDDVGLIVLNDYVACSPDGLVEDDGIVEIKVPDSHNYFEQVIEIYNEGEKAIPSEHYAQMQFNLYVSNRKWCDYILYNPKHSKHNNGLYIYRVNIDYAMQDLIRQVLQVSIEKIKEYIEQYHDIV
jgi:exodeoxyribonuclease (lambda-induced)